MKGTAIKLTEEPAPALADGFRRLLQAEHDDPFALLGMHHGPLPGTLVVRAFLPDADSVAVVARDGGTLRCTLTPVEAPGLFSGTLEAPDGRFAYRLRVTDRNGSRDIDDPYSFAPILGEIDTHLLAEGSHWQAWTKLGAHPMTLDGVDGVGFAVWAPNARRVSVVGPFNRWDGRIHAMRRRIECGVWEIFIPAVAHGELYKYELLTTDGSVVLKSDPYAFWCEVAPRTAARVWAAEPFAWDDESWMRRRAGANDTTAPVAIYEVHLPSWRRHDDGTSLSYAELADTLVPYVRDMGFTHIELLPVSEHPFAGSWGYQPTALYAPSSRLGTPDDFRGFVDRCHREGIGVILDWVAAHFPSDAHGLARFDGTWLYEHADPRLGEHRDWRTLIYNYGRNEVANFLIANALYWLEEFHIDGLRVDAVASMLYLDYSREPGEWLPNIHGGNENLEAIAFLKRLNELVYGSAPAGAVTVAEESTSWPMVTRPTWLGGLGFGYKWNMGWMNDTLRYIGHDPVHRRYHQDSMTFGLLYAFHENFILPLSHDEVVHGKRSLVAKMPGDDWQRFANLRLYLAFQYTQPGKKLLFMGGEIAQWSEWNHDGSVDWAALIHPWHRGMQRLVTDLNHRYRTIAALHEADCAPSGFSWIDCQDVEQSVLAWFRQGARDADKAVVVCNFTPVVRRGYRIGVPVAGTWREALNTDAIEYGGSGVGNLGQVPTEPVPWHGFAQSLALTLPPLGALVLLPPDA